MAQSTDLVVPNTSAAGVRSGINTRLQAIATHQSGATAPSTTYPYQFWADTTAGLLKQRDGANSSWITIGTLGASNLGLAPLASPTFTGTPAAPTASAGTNTTQLATTAFVATATGALAPLASPTFTGTPAAPTASAGTNTTQLATTAFVAAATANASPVLMTSQASTSGTSIDFTGIPSWAKRVTVMFNGVSTSGGSSYLIQLGTGVTPTYQTSSYSGSAGRVQSNTTSESLNSAGFRVNDAIASASTHFGTITLLNISGNIWTESGVLCLGNVASTNTSGGSVSLSAALTAVRITTVNGTDTFDAGTINVLYE